MGNCDRGLYELTGPSLLAVLPFIKGQYNRGSQELDSHLNFSQVLHFSALQGMKSNSLHITNARMVLSAVYKNFDLFYAKIV